MRLPYYTKKDWVIIGILLPPAVLLVNYVIFGARYFKQTDIFLWATVISAVTGFASWQLQIIIAILLQHKYPRYSQTIKRLFFALLSYFIVTAITIWLAFLLYSRISFFQYTINYTHLAWAIIACSIVDVLAASFHEGVAFYERWKKVADEAEQLKKENLQTQLDSLKAQVNPHFLFNSLNSLSSLISEDAEKAEKFLDELSKVYRYLLRNNEDDLTSLHSEIQFIQSYYHLLKTRYGDSLELHLHIEEASLQYQLPPLTLQMLVENAVKHNMMMKDMPLQIVIRTSSNRLIISNNLQRKVRQVTSNRIGLSNIIRKYQLLIQDDIHIQENGNLFTVTLPLIGNKECEIKNKK